MSLEVMNLAFCLAFSQLHYGLKQGLLAATGVKGYKFTLEHGCGKQFRAPKRLKITCKEDRKNRSTKQEGLLLKLNVCFRVMTGKLRMKLEINRAKVVPLKIGPHQLNNKGKVYSTNNSCVEF